MQADRGRGAQTERVTCTYALTPESPLAEIVMITIVTIYITIITIFITISVSVFPSR
jgi:hypothetical protein